MSKSKKPIIYITCFFLVLSSVIIPYYNSKASELAIATGLASSGTALLGLLAMSGVGMELENNRKFNDLTDEEKTRIENGLVTNFEDVALQRGAGLEKVKTWLSDLKNGVLDKSNEIYGIFKSWSLDVELSESSFVTPDLGVNLSPSVLNGFTFTNSSGVNVTISSEFVNYISNHSNNNVKAYIVDSLSTSSTKCTIYAITDIPSNNSYTFVDDFSSLSGTAYTMGRYNYDYSPMSTISYGRIKKYGVGIYSSYPFITPLGENINGMGFSDSSVIFSTNSDYLERLQGQEKEQVEVIDVTDIKNPIVESKGNSIARIDWNRGTNNNNNNNDDEQTIKGGLVPADVWYESLDDYIDGQNNAIETYDTHISENPEDKDKYFISPSPIVQVGQYYNILPVVSVPSAGTIVNNYYTYNDYNNFNITIYNEPYNPDIVPNLPMLIFENKFPFCIPWDIFSFISAFYVEKEAPRIDIPFPIKGANGLDVETVTIDLSGYEYLSTIIRVMFFVLFLVGLMILTRQLIKG